MEGAARLGSTRRRRCADAATRSCRQSTPEGDWPTSEVDAGADLLIPGDMGIGNTTPAAVLIGVLTGSRCRRRDRPRDRYRRRRARSQTVRWLPPASRGRLRSTNRLALLAAVGGADIAAWLGFWPRPRFAERRCCSTVLVSGAAALRRRATGTWRSGMVGGGAPVGRARARTRARDTRFDAADRSRACDSAREPGRCWPCRWCTAAADILGGMATFGEATRQ